MAWESRRAFFIKALIAAVLDDFLDNAASAEVIGDGKFRSFFEEIWHHQGDFVVAPDSLAFFVNHHKPVDVAIEAKAEQLQNVIFVTSGQVTRFDFSTYFTFGGVQGHGDMLNCTSSARMRQKAF